MSNSPSDFYEWICSDFNPNKNIHSQWVLGFQNQSTSFIAKLDSDSHLSNLLALRET